FDGGDLRSLGLLEVSLRILLRFGQAARTAEVDLAPVENTVDVFAGDLFARYGTSINAIAFAQEFDCFGRGLRSSFSGLGTLCRRGGNQCDDDNECECKGD